MLLACNNIIQLITIAPLFEAAALPSAAHVLFWGALWHLTADVLLPVSVCSAMERRERRHFLRDVAAERIRIRLTVSLQD